jgi:hypothetical protein
VSVPVANATLTAISGGSTAEDYDTPAGAPTAKWTGSVGVYVVDELVRAVSPGRVDELRKTSIVLPAALARNVKRSDTLTFRYQGAAQTRTARDVRITEIARTARVTFEDA